MFAFPIIKGHAALGPGQTDRYFSVVWHSCTSCSGILVKAEAPTPKYTVHILPGPGGDTAGSETWEAGLCGNCDMCTVELTVPLLSLDHLRPSSVSMRVLSPSSSKGQTPIKRPPPCLGSFQETLPRKRNLRGHRLCTARPNTCWQLSC